MRDTAGQRSVVIVAAALDRLGPRRPLVRTTLAGAAMSAELTIVTIVRGHDQGHDRSTGSAAVLVSGELNSIGVACLRAQLAGLPRAGIYEMRLDLSGVRHHERTLAPELTDERDRLRRRGARLIITSAEPGLWLELDTDDSDHPAAGNGAWVGAGRGTARRRPETFDQP